MKTQFNINAIVSVGDTIHELTRQSILVLKNDIIAAYSAQQTKQHEKGVYLHVTSIVSKKLNQKAVNSGDFVLYDNLRKELYKGVNTMFSGTSYFDYVSNALDRYVPFVQSVYRRKIQKAIENDREYIYLISTKRLVNIFRYLMQLEVNTATVQDTIPMPLEIVQDLHTFLLSCEIDITAHNYNYVQFKSVLDSTFYGVIDRRVKLTDNTIITEKGVYKTSDDGTQRRVIVFKTHDFITIGKKTDTYTIDGDYITVHAYKSIFDMLYTMCDTYITKERRNFTSNDTYENLTEKDTAQIDIDLIEAENSSLYASMFKALTDSGLKKATAQKYINFALLLVDGHTKKDAEQMTELSQKQFNRISVKYAQAIRPLLTA